MSPKTAQTEAVSAHIEDEIVHTHGVTDNAEDAISHIEVTKAHIVPAQPTQFLKQPL